jgi:hypothetical protein
LFIQREHRALVDAGGEGNHVLRLAGGLDHPAHHGNHAGRVRVPRMRPPHDAFPRRDAQVDDR